MAVKRILSAGLLLALLLSAAQKKDPIPQFEGDGDSRHDNQPAFCVNHSNGKYAQNCACTAMNPDNKTCTDNRDRGGVCMVHCRPSACKMRQPLRYMKRNRAPADMIGVGLILAMLTIWLVCGLNQCGRHDYGNLERVLAEAPK